MLEPKWIAPPAPLPLPDGSVHLWRAPLDDPGASIELLTGLLSADERARAARFHFDGDRRRFVVSHAALRSILGKYFGASAQEIDLRLGEYGKPYCAAPRGQRAFEFNLSHSHKLAMVACTLGRRLGIDAEYVRDFSDRQAIADRFFSPREQAALGACAQSEKQKEFFALWTRKEAYLKARGDGLRKPLDEFDVAAIPGDSAQWFTGDDDASQLSRWSVITFSPIEGYLASLAIEGDPLPLERLEFFAG